MPTKKQQKDNVKKKAAKNKGKADDDSKGKKKGNKKAKQKASKKAVKKGAPTEDKTPEPVVGAKPESQRKKLGYLNLGEVKPGWTKLRRIDDGIEGLVPTTLVELLGTGHGDELYAPPGETEYYVMFDFIAARPNDLTVKKGEHVMVEAQAIRTEGFMAVRSGEKKGLIPAVYAIPLVDWERKEKGLPKKFKIASKVVPEGDGELALEKGDTVVVLDRTDKGWSFAIHRGVEGWFPTHVCVSMEEKENMVRAIYDYDKSQDNDITLRKGDVVEVLRENAGDGWMFGRLFAEGYFPASFVEKVPPTAPPIENVNVNKKMPDWDYDLEPQPVGGKKDIAELKNWLPKPVPRAPRRKAPEIEYRYTRAPQPKIDIQPERTTLTLQSAPDCSYTPPYV